MKFHSLIAHAWHVPLQDKMEVIIMVSGWMEEDEDDKRTFGVVPDEMSLLVSGYFLSNCIGYC